MARSKRALQHLARDHARLPMQWDGTPHAGFTVSDKPWMRVNDNYGDIYVKKQILDEKSILSFWKQVLSFVQSFVQSLCTQSFRAQSRKSRGFFSIGLSGAKKLSK